MTKSKSLSADDALAAEMLRALAGFVCTGCGRELDRQAREWVCPDCLTAHCPVCERGTHEQCEHRIAYHIKGRWNFPGVIGPMWTMPHIPVAPPFLLDFSPEQERAALGAAETWIDPNELLRPLPAVDVFQRLAANVSLEGGVFGGKPSGAYYFARDPDASREKARQMLAELTGAVARLAACRPPGTEFIERVLPFGGQLHPPGPRSFGDLRFGPRGTSLLAYGVRNHILIWDLSGDKPPRKITYPKAEWVRCFWFGNGGRTLAVLTTLPNSRSIVGASYGMTQIWDTQTARSLRTQPHWSIKAPGEPPEHFDFVRYLHGGETQLIACGNTLQLVPFSPPPDADADEFVPDYDTGLSITVRNPVVQAASAPEEDRFATVQGNYIIIWRVPPDAVPKERYEEQTTGVSDTESIPF